MAFCSYCSLFQHSAVLVSVDWHVNLMLPGVFPPLVAFAIAAWLGYSILAASPRGPPAFQQL